MNTDLLQSNSLIRKSRNPRLILYKLNDDEKKINLFSKDSNYPFNYLGIYLANGAWVMPCSLINQKIEIDFYKLTYG
jgi:hypothetical protein